MNRTRVGEVKQRPSFILSHSFYLSSWMRAVCRPHIHSLSRRVNQGTAVHGVDILQTFIVYVSRLGGGKKEAYIAKVSHVADDLCSTWINMRGELSFSMDRRALPSGFDSKVRPLPFPLEHFSGVMSFLWVLMMIPNYAATDLFVF